MTNFLTSVLKACRPNWIAAGTVIIFVFGRHLARAAVLLSADPAVPATPAVATIDPEELGTAERGITGTRQLRQTFQNAADFIVGDIVLSLEMTGNDGGLVLDFFEVADVNAGTWTPLGDPLETISLPLTTDLPSATMRLGLTLTESSLFNLPARNTGTEGYGIEISNLDQATNIASIHHSNSGTDEFSFGKFYTEDGGDSGTGNRDFGVWLVASTAPPPLAGDTDGDGVVELEDDLNPIRLHYLQSVTMRSQGDLDGDDLVTFADFREWKTAFLTGGGSLADVDVGFLSGSVPEPSSLALAGLLLSALGFRFRRRDSGRRA